MAAQQAWAQEMMGSLKDSFAKAKQQADDRRAVLQERKRTMKRASKINATAGAGVAAAEKVGLASKDTLQRAFAKAGVKDSRFGGDAYVHTPVSGGAASRSLGQINEARSPTAADDDVELSEPQCLPYFHGLLDQAASAKLLEANNGLKKNGKFLVCQDPAQKKTPNNYMLAVVFKGRATQHILRLTNGVGWSINNKQSPYTELSMLIEYMNKKRKDLMWPVPLTTPCVTAAPPLSLSTAVLGRIACFRGTLEMAEANKLLQAGGGTPPDGLYVLRFEPGQPNVLYLSVTFKGKATHHAIALDSSGKLSLNGKSTTFVNVTDLVAHLGQKRKDLRWPVPLVNPLAPAGNNALAAARATKRQASDDAQAQNILEAAKKAEVERLAAEAAAAQVMASAAATAAGGGNVDDLPYYHGVLATEAANALITPNGAATENGVFLVRKDPSQAQLADNYTLSVVFKGRATNHILRRTAGAGFTVNDKQTECQDLAALVDHLGKRRKEIMWPVALVTPIAAGAGGIDSGEGGGADTAAGDDGVDDQDNRVPYFHGILTQSDADALLLADGGAEQDGKFLLRRDPTQGPTDMMLSVIFRTRCTHHVLQLPQGGVITLNGKPSTHTDIGELVAYLSKKRKDLMWPVPLLHPINA